jgi:hypothetical protein
MRIEQPTEEECGCNSKTRATPASPDNGSAEKHKFFSSHDYEPSFRYEVKPSPQEEKQYHVSDVHIHMAKRVIDKVIAEFGSDRAYYATFGEKLTVEEARSAIEDYCRDCGVLDKLTIVMTDKINCYGRMAKSQGCYTVYVNSHPSNPYLSVNGIRCLADHELGTHFVRMQNDETQPWSGRRSAYGLSKFGEWRRDIQTEEGLASLNTVINAPHQYLWLPALLYYACAKARSLSFRDLYAHLEQYISDRDERWSMVVRCRGFKGGWGKDQAYFEGCVKFLQELERGGSVFGHIYSGRLSVEDFARPNIQRMIGRYAGSRSTVLPKFASSMPEYLSALRQIGEVNEITGSDDMKTSFSRITQRTTDAIGKRAQGSSNRAEGAPRRPSRSRSTNKCTGEECSDDVCRSKGCKEGSKSKGKYSYVANIRTMAASTERPSSQRGTKRGTSRAASRGTSRGDGRSGKNKDPMHLPDLRGANGTKGVITKWGGGSSQLAPQRAKAA